MKRCKKCGDLKALVEFSAQRDMKDGLRAHCKPCNSATYALYCKENPEKVKDAYYRKKYGITLAGYKGLFSRQEGLCAICHGPEQANNKSLAVDHDHATGLVRGLLCHKCNAGLGHFNDDPVLLRNALDYVSASIFIEVIE